jgi:hypothetical protein
MHGLSVQANRQLQTIEDSAPVVLSFLLSVSFGCRVPPTWTEAVIHKLSAASRKRLILQFWRNSAALRNKLAEKRICVNPSSK